MRNNPCKTELKVARSQRNKLRTMSAKLKEMCCEWDGLSGWLETESEPLILVRRWGLQWLNDAEK